MIEVSVAPAPFEVGADLARASAIGDVGGVGLFLGVVRGDDGVVALELEHYPGMTERVLEQMAAEAVRRWSLMACIVRHRVGRLIVGAPIVLVIAASTHRAAALDATTFVIDQLKTGAPFWKREHRADASTRWVQPRVDDLQKAVAWTKIEPPLDQRSPTFG